MATAVRKKNAPKVLTVSTPKTRKLSWMSEAGIIVPQSIPLDDERVPLDFTRLSSRGIGELQSRYAVRHAHAVYSTAVLESDLIRLKRDLKMIQSKFRIRHSELPKNIADAMMEEDEEISGFLNKIVEIEMRVVLMEAVCKSYEAIRNAASREMSRQMKEASPLD